MNLHSKKYYSISEVAQIIGIPLHKLRYLEKSKPDIDIIQIRGRRYYTSTDIELIKHLFNKDSKFQFNLFLPTTDESANSNDQVEFGSAAIQKIDLLISKLAKLEKDILKAL